MQALADPSGGPVELVVQLEVPRFEAAPLPPSVSTFDTRRGTAGSYTLDGVPVDRAQMDRHAEATRGRILEDLSRQIARRRAVVDAAIARLGLASRVQSRSSGGFRITLPRPRARAMLVRLGRRLRHAALSPRARLHLTDAINPSGTGALPKIGVSQYAHDYGYDGNGVGIWHSENFAPHRSWLDLAAADMRFLTGTHNQPVTSGTCNHDDECCSNKCVSGLCQYNGLTCKWPCHMELNGFLLKCVGDKRGYGHSTMVALALNKTAPHATLYHAFADITNCMIYDDIVKQKSPQVYVGSQSWSNEGDGATNPAYNIIGNWGTCNGEWDNFIVASRIAHFHSSGNLDANYVGSPGRAYNVTAVGNYDHITERMNVSLPGVDVESGYLNPDTGAEKPEIVAPGTAVAVAPNFARIGSSISAPVAAAFVADMMEGSSFFKNQPQAVRAYLIAGAHNVHGNVGFQAYGLSPNDQRDGAGRIDFLDTFYNRWGKTWSYGGNKDYFDSQDRIVEQVNLVQGKRYTIAIAWLAYGSYVYYMNKLNMTMRLKVSNGSYTYTAYRPQNNFQLVDMVAPAGGQWTVTIERVYNSGLGGVDLALTVGQHAGTWTCAPGHYGTGDGCHCGCGIVDPDCSSRSASACHTTNAWGSCGVSGTICSCRNDLCGSWFTCPKPCDV